MKLNNSGYAFPLIERNEDGSFYVDQSGMSLRQWYAGMAMQGILAGIDPGAHNQQINFERVSNSAVLQADALLAELAKEGQPK